MCGLANRHPFDAANLDLLHTGPEKYVILKAGLDDFAYRDNGRKCVCEVDHPALQQWKRDRLQAIGGSLWRRSDALRPIAFGRLARAVVP
ncbi:class I SAM-dependent methyltransferase [Spirillospora sp. NPDC048911]|uniref:class I SAM-dependent methyltransferase n=1 Tax=Spirillospora sp. NPDC048911 TaxID=3364527 RepID=UPI0037138F64